MSLSKKIIIAFTLFFIVLKGFPSNNLSKKKTNTKTIERLIKIAPYQNIDGNIKILISPHASLEFAGRVQATGYKTILKSNQSFERIIILGPSHFKYFRGFKTYTGKKMEDLKIDKIFIEKIMKKVRGVEYDNKIFEKEYSIKRQLGFIKKYKNKIKLVPIIIGDCTKYQLKQLAKTIIKIMKTNTLLIISTDMSHYHNKKYANMIDNYSINVLGKIDPNLIYRLSKMRRVEFCGWRGIYVAVYIANKMGLEFKPILYGDSSFYDNEKVVGYLSAIFYKPITLKYDKKTEKIILKIIKENMYNYFRGKIYTYKGAIPNELNEKRGVFITLKKNGRLRSCVGTLISDYPLYEFLPYVSRAVLSKDKRFEPIKKRELKSLLIEVSIIYDYGRLFSIKRFKIGENGLFIVKGEKRGVLLPQVAIEYRLNKKQFLIKLCEKASLKHNCYKDDDVKIYKFKALVFDN